MRIKWEAKLEILNVTRPIAKTYMHSALPQSKLGCGRIVCGLCKHLIIHYSNANARRREAFLKRKLNFGPLSPSASNAPQDTSSASTSAGSAGDPTSMASSPLPTLQPSLEIPLKARQLCVKTFNSEEDLKNHIDEGSLWRNLHKFGTQERNAKRERAAALSKSTTNLANTGHGNWQGVSLARLMGSTSDVMNDFEIFRYRREL